MPDRAAILLVRPRIVIDLLIFRPLMRRACRHADRSMLDA